MADMLQLPPVRRPIVFWGPKNSGKTTFLGRMLMRPAEFDDAGEWHVAPADERSADYAADVLETLRREGAVRPTLVTERPFRFRLQRRRRGLLSPRLAEWDLLVLDPKGELFLRNRLRESDDGSMLELIAQAHALLLLIDPVGDTVDSYWEMLADNIHEFVMAMKDGEARALDGVNRIRIRTAVCLTKMDLFPECDDALAFLQQRLGPAFDLVQRSFTNYRVFACSALATPPWGLLPPLQWLTADSRIRLPF
jgi:hypothetical protein